MSKTAEKYSALGVWKRANTRVWILFVVLSVVSGPISFLAKGTPGLLGWAGALGIGLFVMANSTVMNYYLLTHPKVPFAYSMLSFALNMIVVMGGILLLTKLPVNVYVLGIDLVVILAVSTYYKGILLAKAPQIIIEHSRDNP